MNRPEAAGVKPLHGLDGEEPQGAPCRIRRASFQSPSLPAQRHPDQYAAPHEQYDREMEEPGHCRFPPHHEHAERSDADPRVEFRLVHRSRDEAKAPCRSSQPEASPDITVHSHLASWPVCRIALRQSDLRAMTLRLPTGRELEPRTATRRWIAARSTPPRSRPPRAETPASLPPRTAPVAPASPTPAYPCSTAR